MEAPVIAAIIGVVGVFATLIGRDIVMAVVLAKRARAQSLADRSREESLRRHDHVRVYADPLRQAAQSLGFRLKEIIDQGPAHYLMGEAAATDYVEYKRLSSWYRLAALLGWIRAFRRERIYLDPNEITAHDEVSKSIVLIEKSLADGQDVEEMRLTELIRIWKVPNERLMRVRNQVAVRIDSALRQFLASKEKRNAADLKESEQIELARNCANIISQSVQVAIPQTLINATAAEAAVFFDIKEAYLYRDWQNAIGDMMIREVSSGVRRFDVIGFGQFEDWYLTIRKSDSAESRWLKRLANLFHDLDMSKDGVFDARRQQVKNLQHACTALVEKLNEKTMQLAHNINGQSNQRLLPSPIHEQRR